MPLLASTGYWDFGLQENTLKLSPRAFMREFVAKSHLPFTTIAVKKDDPHTVAGVIVCASKKEMAAMNDYGTLLDSRVIALFKNVFTFEITESYHVSFLAVSKNSRAQGLGKKLMSLAADKAKEAQQETLSLYTFSCQTSAIKLYLKMGMIISRVISVAETLPCPHLLYFEKNVRLDVMHDYFETAAYQELKLPNRNQHEKN